VIWSDANWLKSVSDCIWCERMKLVQEFHRNMNWWNCRQVLIRCELSEVIDLMRRFDLMWTYWNDWRASSDVHESNGLCWSELIELGNWLTIYTWCKLGDDFSWREMIEWFHLIWMNSWFHLTSTDRMISSNVKSLNDELDQTAMGRRTKANGKDNWLLGWSVNSCHILVTAKRPHVSQSVHWIIYRHFWRNMIHT
jgi:hypothetical protein